MIFFVLLIINLLFFLTCQTLIYYNVYDNVINNDLFDSNIACKIISQKTHLYQRNVCFGNTNDITNVNTTIYIFDIEVIYNNSMYYAQACSSYLANTLVRNKWDCINYPYKRTDITNKIPMWLCNQCMDQSCFEFKNISNNKIRYYVTKQNTHTNTFISGNEEISFHDAFFNFLPTNMWKTFSITLIVPNLIMCIIHTILILIIINNTINNYSQEKYELITMFQFLKHILNILSIILTALFVFKNSSFDTVFTSKNNILMLISFYFSLATILTYIVTTLIILFCSYEGECLFSIIPIIGMYYIYKQNNDDKNITYYINRKLIMIIVIIHYIPQICIMGLYVKIYTIDVVDYTALMIATASMLLIIVEECLIIN